MKKVLPGKMDDLMRQRAQPEKLLKAYPKKKPKK